MEWIRSWFSKNNMVRLFFMSIAVGTLVYVFTYPDQKNTQDVWSMPLSGSIIILDPGHGGIDGGAVSRDKSVIEKEVTLEISYYLRDLLQQAGALVILTREDDKVLTSDSESSSWKESDLTKRVEIMNESSADMVVSIHLNSIPSPKWRGAQTFYNPNREENKMLAQIIQDELIVSLANTNRKALMNQDLFILRMMEPVGALVEVGFLSNPEEAGLLGTTSYRQQVAEAIYRGMLRYYSGERVSE